MSTPRAQAVPRKALFLELWGLGDAVLMTPALHALRNAGAEVHVLARPASRALLEPAFPELHWIEWTAPWTAFRGKYRLWRWPWREITRLLARLRRESYTDGFSARPDPRDHLWLWLAGVRQRHGFRHRLSWPWLNYPLPWPDAPRHRADDWHALLHAQGLNGLPDPHLPAEAYRAHLPGELRDLPRPLVVLHTGAAQPTRRWPEDSWRETLLALRIGHRFSLVLIPDPTGHGEGLADLADLTLTQLALPALAATLASADAFLGHDSGPMHLASALGTPAFALFGPNLPERFGPRHPGAATVHDPQCLHFPCKDSCRFDQPRCLTRIDAARCLATLDPWLSQTLPGPTASTGHSRQGQRTFRT